MFVNERFRFSIERISRLVLVLIWMAVACCSLSAQTERTIIIRLLDSQTGEAIAPVAGDNGISVTVNEDAASPRLTARVNKDGVWELKVGPEVEKVQIDTPAGPGGWGYVFCDCSKFHPATIPSYPVAEILKTGVEAANKCSKRFAQAHAGEIIFFVRRPNWHERLPV
jgi:hypothetical protein